MKNAKNAFTLVELLVVVAIIGILAAVLLGTFSGGTGSARSARCMSNLRNLAAACQSAGVAHGYYPLAGSIETVTVSEYNGKYQNSYGEAKGWISWNSQNAYVGNVNSHRSSGSWNTSMYCEDEEARKFCLTNGVLWKYVSGNHNVYLCPLHVNQGKNPNWSYCMNAYFKWDSSKGKRAWPSESPGVQLYGRLERADRILLFSEIQFIDVGLPVYEDTTGETTDSILQYKGCTGCSSPEIIGFNHKSGKTCFAHVVFADGHTERLTYPKGSSSESEMQDLTKWLCTGKDISFSNSKYEELVN